MQNNQNMTITSYAHNAHQQPISLFVLLKTLCDNSFNVFFEYSSNPRRPLQQTHFVQLLSYLRPQEVHRHSFQDIRPYVS